MLDLRLIRREPDAVRAALARRGADVPVWRLRSVAGQTAILKAAAARDEDWNRADADPNGRACGLWNDWAGAQFLTRHGVTNTPRFIGGDAGLGFILVEDLGDGPDLATVLLGDDPRVARLALAGWVDALAAVHTGAHAQGPQYAAVRTRLGPPTPKEDVRGLVQLIPSRVRVSYDPGFALDRHVVDVIGVMVRELDSPPWQTLTLGDSCPDNNVVAEDGSVRLFDLQWAMFRHALFDVAALHTIMPTCWCVRRIPDGLADALAERYRTRIASVIGVARDEERFRRALAIARAARALLAAVSLLSRAADQTGAEHQELAAYSFRVCTPRQLLFLRLDELEAVAGEELRLAPLGDLARAIRDVARARFGATEAIPLFPAFAGGSPKR